MRDSVTPIILGLGVTLFVWFFWWLIFTPSAVATKDGRVFMCPWQYISAIQGFPCRTGAAHDSECSTKLIENTCTPYIKQ